MQLVLLLLKSPGGIIQADCTSKADTLDKQFASVFTKDECSTYIPEKGDSPYPSMEDIDISPAGVNKLFSGLDPHKATSALQHWKSDWLKYQTISVNNKRPQSTRNTQSTVNHWKRSTLPSILVYISSKT